MKRAIFVSIGLVLLIGCGSKRGTGGSVSGKVTYNGNPVNRATLIFQPTAGEGKEVDITTAQDGTFTATNIPPGEYKIYIEATRLPPEAAKGPQGKGMDPAKAAEMKQKFEKMSGGGVTPTIPFPKKYNKGGNTDLKCTIAEGKQEKLNLELKD